MVDKINIVQSGTESPVFSSSEEAYAFVHRLALLSERATDDSSIDAKLFVPVCNPSDVEKINDRFPGTISVNTNLVQFEDPEVHRVLQASTTVNKDKDEGVSLLEAATATSLPSFQGNKVVEKFDELSMFSAVGTMPLFRDCANLKSVDVPESMRVPQGGFANCTELESIGSGVLSAVTSTSSTMFYNTPKLAQALYFPNLVTFNCDSNSSYGNVFGSSGITEFHAPNVVLSGNFWGGSDTNGPFVSCKNLRVCDIPAQTYIPENFLRNCTSLETPPDLSLVTTIGPNAFKNTSSMVVDIVLPECVTMPGGSSNSRHQTFYNSGVKSLLALRLTNIIPDGSGGNNDAGFSYCGNLEWVKLRDIEKIGRGTFTHCPKLLTFEIDNTVVPTIGTNVFDSSPRVMVFVPDSAVDDYKAATNWATWKTRIFPISQKDDMLSPVSFADAEVERILRTNSTINSMYSEDGLMRGHAATVTTIPSFANNKVIENFEELQYFKSVTSLGTPEQSAGFNGCTNLTKVVLPPNVEKIQLACFNDVPANIEYLPKSIKNLGDRSFNNCGITAVVDLPNLTGAWGHSAKMFTKSKIRGVKNLGTLTTFGGLYVNQEAGVFYGCTELEYAVLPSTLTSIQADAFRNCTKMHTLIYLNPTAQDLGGNALAGCTALTSIYVPDASVDSYKAASGWSTYASYIKPLSSYTGDLLD